MDKSHLLENWQLANWTGVEWTKSMVKELHNFYFMNDPLPLVQPRCFGSGAHKYVSFHITAIRMVRLAVDMLKAKGRVFILNIFGNPWEGASAPSLFLFSRSQVPLI